MKRRLTIARSLINEPDLLLLDEPTTGLDPQARHLLWDRLYRLKQRGVTLVLTTHYMDEAEQLCDRLVVMDKAKIVAEGSPRELIEQYSTREVLELRFPAGRPGDARRPARRARRADRAAARPRAALRRRRRGGGRRRPRARPRARDGPRPALVARGRLPAADRPLAGRVGRVRRWPRSTSTARVLERNAAGSTAASGAGGLVTTFLAPVLFLAAMGVGLGTFVDAAGTASELLGGVSYLAFLAPGLLAAPGDADGGVRGRRSRSWAGSSGTGPSTAMIATPIAIRGIVLGELGWIAVAPGVSRAPSSSVVMVALRARPLAARDPRDPGGRPDRARLRGADRGLHGDPADATRASTRSSASGSRRCSCSRARSSRSSSCRAFLQPIAWLTPLWHGVDLAASLALGHGRPGCSPSSTSASSRPASPAARSSALRDVPTGAGWCERGMTADDRLLPGSPRRSPSAAAGPAGSSSATCSSTGGPGSSSSRASSSRSSTCSRSASASARSSATVAGPDGQPIPYAVFVAPALLATSAMNGAIYDSTFNVFFKLQLREDLRRDPRDADGRRRRRPRRDRLGADPGRALRDRASSSSWSSSGWSRSPWSMLALPAALLIGFAFAAVGMAATTFMRTLAGLRPHPSSSSCRCSCSRRRSTRSRPTPRRSRSIVQLTPLYHGVDLIRGLTDRASSGRASSSTSPTSRSWALIGLAIVVAAARPAAAEVSARAVATADAATGSHAARRRRGALDALEARSSRLPSLPAPRRVARAVAREKVARFRDETYWGRPVPGFGDPDAADPPRRARAGRPRRQPDRAGLHRRRVGRLPVGGAARGRASPTGRRRRRADDGLTLTGAWVAAAVRCAPPANKPTVDERDACAPFLARELALLDRSSASSSRSGPSAGTPCLRALAAPATPSPRPRPRFGHGAEVAIGPYAARRLVPPEPAEHVHRTLTPPMLEAVLAASSRRSPVSMRQALDADQRST